MLCYEEFRAIFDEQYEENGESTTNTRASKPKHGSDTDRGNCDEADNFERLELEIN